MHTQLQDTLCQSSTEYFVPKRTHCYRSLIPKTPKASQDIILKRPQRYRILCPKNAQRVTGYCVPKAPAALQDTVSQKRPQRYRILCPKSARGITRYCVSVAPKAYQDYVFQTAQCVTGQKYCFPKNLNAFQNTVFKGLVACTRSCFLKEIRVLQDTVFQIVQMCYRILYFIRSERYRRLLHCIANRSELTTVLNILPDFITCLISGKCAFEV